jgi:hypothetical protein
MSLSKRVRFEVFKRDNFTCQYCGAKPPDTVLEVDHVVARCNGGSDDQSNLRTACWNCNRGKAGIPLSEVLEPNTYRLKGGVWAGRAYKFTIETGEPFLWLATDDEGGIFAFEDAWQVDESGIDLVREGSRMLHGHPGFSSPTRPATDANWFNRAYQMGLRPRVIGGYSVPLRERGSGQPVTTMEWVTLDDILIELTA